MEIYSKEEVQKELTNLREDITILIARLFVTAAILQKDPTREEWAGLEIKRLLEKFVKQECNLGDMVELAAQAKMLGVELN